MTGSRFIRIIHQATSLNRKAMMFIKKILAGAAGGALLSIAFAGVAQATETPAPKWSDCSNLKEWYVNSPDEDDRKPTPGKDGLEFVGNQLIHHEVTGLTTSELEHGTFKASPAPDQNSFFSVEVNDGPGTGTYATLRWNTDTSKWEMSTGGQFYTNESADDLVKMTTPAKSHKVISFGIGYTNSPKSDVKTTVESMTFRGHLYPLDCKPVVKPTPSTSTSTKPTVKPTASHTSSAPVQGGSNSGGGTTDAGPSLPVTGAPAGLLAGGAALLVILGGGAMILARKRRENTYYKA